MRVAVLHDAEPGGAGADHRGHRLVEPDRHHGERDWRRVRLDQREQSIECRAAAPRVVVPPPEGRRPGRPAIELGAELLPRGRVPGVRHDAGGAVAARRAPRGVRKRWRVCSERPR